MSSPYVSAAVTTSASILRSGQRATDTWLPFGRSPRSSEATARKSAVESAFPIICVCHLSWDWVWQRPQQYLSRFSRRHPVLFVETYCADVSATRLEIRQAESHPNVTVLKMHLPATRWHESGFIDAERRRALKEALASELRGRFENPVLWFYDPMAVVAFARQLNERAIVYDCMDELSQFRGAPPELIEREKTLLKHADVVFCGGRKMREKRLPLNANTHFFGTGVDIDHFGQALLPELKVPAETANLSGPVLGYFGVVDERIDYELLARLADARNDWHIVMVGPHAKVNPADFPKKPNLHFIGARPYAQLPALTKGFSVCLMPFALNAATEYINPTKALEYMAAGRAVVSTALDEVKSNFATVSQIAHSHEEFVELCLREASSPSRPRISRGLRLAAENTWEANTAKMDRLIVEALAVKERNPAKLAPARTEAGSTSLQPAQLAYV